MTNNKPYSVTLQRTFLATSKSIFNLFQEGAIFKFTLADTIQYNFIVGGKFHLTFNNRGTIHGQFIEIKKDHLIIEWNVDGFQRPSELGTVVEVSFSEEKEECLFTLIHKNIMQEEACAAKQRAWTEILVKVEQEIVNKN